jgi:hypothetical protein
LARRDHFERACKFVGRNLDPALDLLDRLLRFFDSRGDIEQVLAAAIDLQYMAAPNTRPLPATALRAMCARSRR